MKTLKIFPYLIIIFNLCSCNSDDDGSSNGDTEDLLTDSTWYQESRSPEAFSDCEKNGSFKFNNDNTLDIESFNDDSGTCESLETISVAYELSSMMLTIPIDSEIITATINSISESSLSVTDSEGDTIIFDKIQG